MSAGDCGNGDGGGCQCGCCCVHNKMEDIKPHPVMEQLPGVQYCINSPPPLRSGSYSSGVPALSNDSRYHCLDSKYVCKSNGRLRRLSNSLFSDSGISGDFQKFERTMRGMQGALIVTSCFQMLIGFLGVWRNVVRFLTPLSMVPLMTFTGLGLYYLGFSMYLPRYAKAKIKRRVCDRYALLFSVAFVWGYAQILTSSGAYHNSSSATQASCRTDRAGLITGAPWLYIPYPFQWGRPTFQAGEAFAMMAASFVASLESTGTFLATARYGSATPVPASVVSRGVGWLGFGTLLSGLFGTLTGCTASVENAGLLAMTRVGSRRVVQVSAGFMIFFSLLEGSEYLFSSVVSDLDPSFGIKSMDYRCFERISHVQFNDMVTVIFTSHATVAVLVAVILDCTLVREDDEGGKDSGSHWDAMHLCTASPRFILKGMLIYINLLNGQSNLDYEFTIESLDQGPSRGGEFSLLMKKIISARLNISLDPIQGKTYWKRDGKECGRAFMNTKPF
ncbi:hypothetical protein RHSIM_Rhsim06G0063000 [Rhododendron simsii]|uniref:Uncharacterized protein n=1 Tax=Rhododendron simsii TaxID=118357 RepID=A0A834GSJ4_RHOSS|nr:hypothetical protein RHSIM_Rhsim06G0063000 [Rhododendron simsii]